MKKNNDLVTMTAFTFKTCLYSKLFRIIAVVGVIGILIFMNVDNLSKLFIEDVNVRVGVSVSTSEVFADNVTDALNILDSVDGEKISSENTKNIEKDLDKYDSEYAALVILDENDNAILHYNSTNVDGSLLNIIAEVVNQAHDYYLMEKVDISANQQMFLSEHTLSYVPHDSNSNAALINIIAIILVFLILTIYVVYLGNMIIEEKTGHISETLLSYVKPINFLYGKVLGILLALLLHIGIFVLTFAISKEIFAPPENGFAYSILNIFNEKTIFITGAMLILGYISYGFLYMCNASFVDTIQDSGQATIIQTILLIVSFYASFILQMHFNEVISEVLIYIPFVSIFNNLVYVSVMDPEWNKIILIVSIQIIETIVIAYFCSKGFMKGITNYGKRRKHKTKFF